MLAPEIGTSAGVPLAGLAACVSLSNVTRRIGGRLKAANLVCELPSDDAKLFLDPDGKLIWSGKISTSNFGIVDDDVFVCLKHPDQAAEAAGLVASIVFDEYHRAGLSLHLKPSKTAAVISWKGDGAMMA